MSTLDRGGGLAAAVATSGARVPATAAPANPIAGDLRLERLDSAVFGNARTLRVLVPSGCDVPANRERRYQVLYLDDGQNLFAPSTSTFTHHHRALLGARRGRLGAAAPGCAGVLVCCWRVRRSKEMTCGELFWHW